MTARKVQQLLPAAPLSEGGGIIVRRTIGTLALRHLDPFLLPDHFSSDNPSDYIAGFPDHPHRGFITLTYMLDGHMLHQDSMGNRVIYARAGCNGSRPPAGSFTPRCRSKPTD